jgi:DNA-binding transcriptional MerR regulator
MVKPLTTKAFAAEVGLSPQTIRRLARRGLVHCVIDFRGWRKFAPAEVERLRQRLGWSVLEQEVSAQKEEK